MALYREVLGVEPGNPEVHRRLAPLLARTREPEEAWRSYRRAAEGMDRKGFLERALGVYREAAHHLPRESGAWLAIAELEVRRGRKADALAALRTGRGHLRSRSERAQAIRLLTRARELDPDAFEPSFELAGLLARTGERRRALELLAVLSGGRRGRELRRVRGRQLALSPGLFALARWLAALVS